MGHARALLGVKEPEVQMKLAEKVKREGASVRQLEEWVQQIHQSGVKKKKPKKAEKVDPQIRRYEEMLQESLNTPVRIRHGKRKGKIEIEYFSQSELERLLELLQRDPLIGG